MLENVFGYLTEDMVNIWHKLSTNEVIWKVETLNIKESFIYVLHSQKTHTTKCE